MTEVDPLTTAITPIADVTELAAPLEGVSLSQIKSETLLTLREDTGKQFSYPPGMAVQSAMGRLVRIITLLRSPDSGWPSKLPRTPKNLLIYVAEEAYGVLETLKASQTDTGIGKSIAHFELSGSLLSSQSPYILVEGLIFRLLWYIAKTSYEIMQLTGGIKARILSPGKGPGKHWQTGILRLVTILAANTPDIHWSFDLVTSEPPQSYLRPDSLIQLREGETPQSVANLLQRLMQQIQAATPSVKIFTEKAKVDLLEPGQNWQAGEIQLLLDLQFITDDSFAIGDNISTEGDPIIRFTDKTVIDAYGENLLEQELSTVVPYLQTVYNPKSDLDDRLQRRSILLAIVETAAAAANRCLENPLYGCFTQEIQLYEWIPHLLWQLSSSSYDIMRLLGGVKAYILQPEWGWELGILRVLAVLKTTTENTYLQLDLATGEVVKPSYFHLMSDAIIELAESGLSKESEQVGNMLTKLIKQIQATTTLNPFLDGTKIEFLTSAGDWQPGTLQLSIDLEFIPNDN